MQRLNMSVYVIRMRGLQWCATMGLQRCVTMGYSGVWLWATWCVTMRARRPRSHRAYEHDEWVPDMDLPPPPPASQIEVTGEQMIEKRKERIEDRDERTKRKKRIMNREHIILNSKLIALNGKQETLDREQGRANRAGS